jgi:hypothetical protein
VSAIQLSPLDVGISQRSEIGVKLTVIRRTLGGAPQIGPIGATGVISLGQAIATPQAQGLNARVSIPIAEHQHLLATAAEHALCRPAVILIKIPFNRVAAKNMLLVAKHNRTFSGAPSREAVYDFLCQMFTGVPKTGPDGAYALGNEVWGPRTRGRKVRNYSN